MAKKNGAPTKDDEMAKSNEAKAPEVEVKAGESPAAIQKCKGCIWLATPAGKGVTPCASLPVKEGETAISETSDACKSYTAETPEFAKAVTFLLTQSADTLAKMRRSLPMFTDALARSESKKGDAKITVLGTGDLISFEIDDQNEVDDKGEPKKLRIEKAKVVGVTKYMARVMDISEDGVDDLISLDLRNQSIVVLKKAAAKKVAAAETGEAPVATVAEATA